MRTLIFHAYLYDTAHRTFTEGGVLTENGVFVRVYRQPITDPYEVLCDRAVDADGCYLVPGLVDVHTHGRAGGDFVSADEDKLTEMAKSYLASGVTSVMPTLASAPLDALYCACDRINRVREHTGGARFVGTHLEGRYLNPAKRGAHAPELLVKPDAEELRGLMERMGLPCHISAALELDTDGSFAKAAQDFGATLSLGHTAATYDEASLAFSRGATAVTHLYNCMPPIHHREGGAAVAAMTGNVFCELIVDGFHISPPVVKMTERLTSPDRLTLITDSMEATGCPDGEYSIAGMPVTVKDGKALTHDGAIAGSTLSLFDGVKNLMRFADISFGKALYYATATPAKEIGVFHRLGSVAVGKYADFLLVDPDALDIREVWLGGERRFPEF